MNRRIRQGLGALIGIGVAALSVGMDGCAKTEIYEVSQKDRCMEEGKTAEECCVSIEGCGQLCYEGMGNGDFSIALNGNIFRHSTAERHLYPCGCHLERRALDSGTLVVAHKRSLYGELP